MVLFVFPMTLVSNPLIQYSEGEKRSAAAPPTPARNGPVVLGAHVAGCVTEVSQIWPKGVPFALILDSRTRKGRLTCAYTVPDVASKNL
jgi:hypothetical protein